MRSLFVVVLLGGVVHAQPSAAVASTQPAFTVAANATMLVEEYLGTGIDVDVGIRLRDKIYIDVAAIVGGSSLIDPAGSGQNSGSLWGARGGMSYVSCSELFCRGLRGAVGVQHNAVSGYEALLEPPTWSDTRDTLVEEALALARVRIGAFAAIEVSAGVRVNQRISGEGDRLGFGVVLAAGLVATI